MSSTRSVVTVTSSAMPIGYRIFEILSKMSEPRVSALLKSKSAD